MSTRWFVHHAAEDPFAFPAGPGMLKLRLFVQNGLHLTCTVLHADRYSPPGREQPQAMERIGSAGAYELYETVIAAETGKCRYLFHLQDASGAYAWYGERGISENRDQAGFFQYAYIHQPEVLKLPSWSEDAVVYQIYPSSFNGGTLEGISEKIPYLQELGVNAVYMTPVFESPSEHKYDTTDYFAVDPAFGTLEDLKTLVATAHQHGIRVVLDAVFNHSGDHFFAFRDVLEKGEASAYKDWFFIRSFPVQQAPEPNYETFGEGIAVMPKLNMGHPAVADYMMEVAKYWVREAGIDGWRLDVANEVNPLFWSRFRRELKEEFPELLIIGEIMHAPGPWLRGDQFDGGMNYVLRDALLEFFAEQTAGPARFMEQQLHIEAMLNDQANSAMFQLLGSHDTLRFLTACKEGGRGWDHEATALRRMKLAVFFQMTYFGIPMIYYGDEVGMEGATDPHCRKPMLWEPETQNAELLGWYRKLIALRREYPMLRGKGAFQPWIVDEARNVVGYFRGRGSDKAGVILNLSPNHYQLELDGSSFGKNVLTDVLTGRTLHCSKKMVAELEPFGGLLLI
ncbi:glycoside hydrolase family 13 protein [Paenibacillus sp. NFR01]|uniref:glycoside hydrolase family 13 protein n=1 Tax=Paenibacillus sp. NFR01 TaxID=1566279 RepID=UPI0008ACD02D|nr:glycoside hydrolase family 13 protein [Paenibacillus sp. NFR01]SEU20184.1 Glycosidase [Paenibacillus sp. NFR01]